MAIISEDSRCALCQQPVGSGDYLATSGCAYDQDHPLWAYCDAPIHWHCYADWEHREEFAAAYHRAQLLRRSPVSVVLRSTSNWLAELYPRIPGLRIHFRRTGTLLEFNSETWASGIQLNPHQQQLLQRDLEECRRSLGDWPSLWAEFDPVAFQRALELDQVEREAQARQKEADDRARLAPYQECWEKMRAELKEGALYCPTCKRGHANIRAYDRSPHGKSIFICQECAFSFGPEGLPEWHAR